MEYEQVQISLDTDTKTLLEEIGRATAIKTRSGVIRYLVNEKAKELLKQ